MGAAGLLRSIGGPRQPALVTPRIARLGELRLGSEFRLPSGDECTVSRPASIRYPGTVEAICEPDGRARLFSAGDEVLFLGSFSPNYVSEKRRKGEAA